MDPVFIFDALPNVMNQDLASDGSLDESDSDAEGFGGSSNHQGSPSITSRLSLLKLGYVISKFNDFKRKLVREIGFDGLLQIKSWQKINLKYNAYLMDRVDVEQSILNLESQGMLAFSDKHVHSVFAIPIGQQTICARAVEPSEACIVYTKLATAISQKGTHSLKAAEQILLKPIDEQSRLIDIQCFKIAFVIYAIGNALAPSSKHGYIKIDFWEAINDVSKIKDWNWCAYLLKHLFRGCRKFKKDVGKRNPTIHIVGCHLFLQVFALDSLELGRMNKPRGVYPRMALFDYESMKKMIDATSVNMGSGEISYHGASVRTELNISTDIVCARVEETRASSARPSLTTKRVQLPPAPTIRPCHTAIGPQEFANHLRSNYPSIASEKLGILLREHNARGLAIISEMRQSFQSSMFLFADKLMSCLSENCTCCIASGRKHCLLKTNAENEPNNDSTIPPPAAADMFETPVGNKLATRLSASFDHEGTSSTNSSVVRKKDYTRSTSITSDSSKKICLRPEEPIQIQSPLAIDTVNNSSLSAKENVRTEITSMVSAFFDDLTASIIMYYAELHPRADYVVFGATNDTVPTKVRLPKCNIARDPWSIGSVPAPPSPTVLRAIKDWITGASSLTLERKWVVHPKPRLIYLDGKDIPDQLARNEYMSHELCTTIFRRLDQMDKSFSKDATSMFWRKFMEPDFSTAVLSNADPLTVQSVRKSLLEETDKFNPASCRMWHIPAILPGGWAVYTFDMLKKRIVVLDPAVGPFGFSNRCVNMHTYIASILHGALFRCFQSLYDSWHCSSGEWNRFFPVLMLEKMSPEDYGLCATFLARNYDGDKLQMPLAKENLEVHRTLMLYEMMRLDGNESLVPSDAIEAIKSSFMAM